MKNYIKINVTFIILILIMLMYSAIFSDKKAYPIKSMYEQNIISTGLSRAFSEIVRFNFEKAKKYNVYSIKIFMFFFSQLFLRIICTIFLLKSKFSKNYILFTDILISILLFLCGFGTFIGDQIFKQ